MDIFYGTTKKRKKRVMKYRLDKLNYEYSENFNIQYINVMFAFLQFAMFSSTSSHNNAFPGA